MGEIFKAVVLDEIDGKSQPSFKELDTDALPAGDVLVKIAYSTLNYKDGLAITGAGKIARSFPMIPGIDFAGEVLESDHAEFRPGNQVVLNGWGIGEKHWGGLAQRARVKGDWLIKLPQGLDARHAMAIGTAGYTAMLAILALERHGLTPQTEGEIAVTGAAGGVGTVAIASLAARGYTVVASSGRPELEPFLKDLGAADVVSRETFSDTGKPPLLSARFAGAIDTVGSNTLAGLLKQMRNNAAVAACGLAGGFDLPTTVMPFILRGVSLLGIDSVYAPKTLREQAYARLVSDLPADKLEALTSQIGLSEVIDTAPAFLKGQVKGRIVVDVNA
ncbi:MAG: MDR family oxidoreductase [Geminicoccaceae bacterium]